MFMVGGACRPPRSLPASNTVNGEAVAGRVALQAQVADQSSAAMPSGVGHGGVAQRRHSSPSRGGGDAGRPRVRDRWAPAAPAHVPSVGGATACVTDCDSGRPCGPASSLCDMSQRSQPLGAGRRSAVVALHEHQLLEQRHILLVLQQRADQAAARTTLSSLLCRASSGMSSATSSLSQSSSSEVLTAFSSGRAGCARRRNVFMRGAVSKLFFQASGSAPSTMRLHGGGVGELDVVKEAAPQERIGQLLSRCST